MEESECGGEVPLEIQGGGCDYWGGGCGACLGEERTPARLEQSELGGPTEALLFKMALYKVPRLSAFPTLLQLFLTDTEPKCSSLKAGVSTLR